MNKVYYKMILDDPATASFCSFPKDYFGTLNDYHDFVEAVREEKGYADTREAFAQFLNGNSLAQHTVCYNKTPILRLASLIGKEHFELDETEWDHENVYGCTYKMRAERISAEQILFRCEDHFYRCIRPTFYGLQFKSREDAEWQDVGSQLWGNKGIIQVTGREHKFRLFVVEKESQKLDVVLSEMWFPQYLNFKTACDEIFGNG